MRLTQYHWPLPPGVHPALADDDLHFWTARLDLPPTQLLQLLALLSDEERARLERFHFPLHRHRYAAAHGQLRLILSTYLPIPPADLLFAAADYGKPYLLNGGELCFNLSHAGDWLAVGVVRGRAIGVDIEQIRPDLATPEIALNYFAAAEQVAFQAVPDAQKPQAFFAAWTRKEAFIKAVGEGLSFPLADFAVTLTPGEPAQLLAIRDEAAAAARWQLWDVAVAEGYAAAVVAEQAITIPPEISNPFKF